MNLISILQSVKNLSTAEAYIQLSCEKNSETFDFFCGPLFLQMDDLL